MRSVLPVLVEVAGGAAEVPVPSGWEELPPLPGVPYLAREADAAVHGRFRSNVTVSAGTRDGGPQPAAREAGDALAAELEGVLVDAVQVEGGALLTVAHDIGAGEVVCVQRQLRVADQAVAVTYTVAVDRFAEDQPELTRLARLVRPREQ